MNPLNQIDEAEVRFEFRRLYREKGFETMLQIVYELITSARIASEVIIEERDNESRNS